MNYDYELQKKNCHFFMFYVTIQFQHLNPNYRFQRRFRESVNYPNEYNRFWLRLREGWKVGGSWELGDLHFRCAADARWRRRVCARV